MNTFYSCLLVLVLAVASTTAFAPASQARSSSALSAKSFLAGKDIDPSANAYARGGKNSWEFELDTMYVEQKVVKKAAPAAKKAAPKKAVAAKKVAPKKAAAKPATKNVSSGFATLFKR